MENMAEFKYQKNQINKFIQKKCLLFLMFDFGSTVSLV